MSAAQTQTAMYRVTIGGRVPRIIGTLRAGDLLTHGDLLTRAKYELAQMVGGTIARSILRGIATQYSDGCFSIRPTNGRGKISTDTNGQIITYWFAPYTF